MVSLRLSLRFALGFMCAFFAASPVLASETQRCAVDDAGQELCISGPAQRIATLSPGATELMFAAGAGEKESRVLTTATTHPPHGSRPGRHSHENEIWKPYWH